MKKHFTITLWVLLLSFGWVQAQEYTDAEIGFERENFREELLSHNELSSDEVDGRLLEARQKHLEYHEQKLKYVRENGSRVAVPVPVTSCVNMDFTQNTNLWTFNASNQNYGTRPSQDLTNNSWGVQGNFFTPAINDPISGITRFQVMPANSFDANLNTVVNPNAAPGTNVMLLGDSQEFLWPGTSNRGQEEISKSFVLNTQNAVLRYGYAIVFENPSHAAVPNSFDIFISVNGIELAGCSAINFDFNTAQMGNGFVPSAINPFDLVRPWTTNTIDLLSQPGVQLGDVITISFRNRDCGFGGHGSYAYVTAQCLPSTQAITSTSTSGNLCVGEEITFTTDVDILVGATTQWQILQGTNVIATIPGGGASIPFTFNSAGNYTINFTMTSPGGCTVNSTTTVIIEDCCEDCIDAGESIFNGVFGMIGECGTFGVNIPPATLDCYTVQIFTGDGTGWTTITAGDLVNDVYEWSYANNGIYTYIVRLIEPSTGETCFYNRKGIPVNCCTDCNTTGINIFESLTETDTCGEYKVAISNEILNCFTVEVYHDNAVGWNTITSSELSGNQYVFSYPDNGNYTFAVRLRDPITGKQCYYNKKSVTVDCFPSVCMENPALELMLTDNLTDILNAILDLDNGFTGRCASGSSSTIVDITTMPEVVQFMQVYDLQNRLQNAIDIRDAQPGNTYPYYTANITHVYYKWGKRKGLHPPCLTITFANQAYGDLGPIFCYVISGGYANGGVPLNPEGLNPESIEEFTNISLNVDDLKATYDYLGTDGLNYSIYDALYGRTVVEGASNGLKFCWFHDLNYTPSVNLLETETENKLILYPNPTSSEFTVSFTEKEQIGNYQVSILSMVGAVVLESKGVNQEKINVQGLPPGVYFVNVLTDKGISYQKQLIVQ